VPLWQNDIITTFFVIEHDFIKDLQKLGMTVFNTMYCLAIVPILIAYKSLFVLFI